MNKQSLEQLIELLNQVKLIGELYEGDDLGKIAKLAYQDLKALKEVQPQVVEFPVVESVVEESDAEGVEQFLALWRPLEEAEKGKKLMAMTKKELQEVVKFLNLKVNSRANKTELSQEIINYYAFMDMNEKMKNRPPAE